MCATLCLYMCIRTERKTRRGATERKFGASERNLGAKERKFGVARANRRTNRQTTDNGSAVVCRLSILSSICAALRKTCASSRQICVPSRQICVPSRPAASFSVSVHTYIDTNMFILTHNKCYHHLKHVTII